MSDDFDFDDDFDDSFLKEVDNITAKAVIPPSSAIYRSTSLPQKGWTGPQKQAAGPSRTTSLGVNSFRKPVVNKTSGPGHWRAVTTPKETPSDTAILIEPSSDDFDDIPLPPESLLALDTYTNPSTKPKSTNSFSNSNNRTLIPPSRSLHRSSSSSNLSSDNLLQTHLSFRKDRQSTKGKRWDRTKFAESGRRIDKRKGKAKGGFDDDDDMDEDEEDGEPLVPLPKPLVDSSAPYKSQKHLPDPETIGTYIYPTNRSRRDYQYEIVRSCFSDNCLVALPTGLGKTFVAGVVMLNFYRWFPTGKIVFLAPTKPLVNQQIEACQLTCGIPSKDAAVMTGSSVSAKERERLWAERRVFYCTPQTLDNDLKRGAVDPHDIVLAVFDEAHKASGSYAYTTILAYLTAHQPYFRVLALTATPGADVPKVQAVVDALHISRIEIREAEAPDIRKCMNEKKTDKHLVQMGEVIEEFRDRWAALMRPFVKKLVDKDILQDRDLNVMKLKTFRLTSRRMEIARDRTSGLRWALGPLQSLEKMATAMRNLLEFSLGMFHTSLTEISGGTSTTGKKAASKGNSNSIRNNFEFQRLLRDVEAEMNSIRIGKDGRSKADRHPKMGKTLELLLGHFAQAAEEEVTLDQKNDTRAMVFCSYRDCVLEIVDMLNEHPGLLKATKFVGQSQGKQEEDKGFTQKEQKKTILDFKEGKFNILVATSIGEEGLDIGEVDFVVVYDMPKQSIKLLQRVGRTGRKRDGNVHILMSEGREDSNWDTAQQTHREIQEEILHSRNLELFEDVEPLLPVRNGRPVIPECMEMEMEVDPWDPNDQKLRKRLPAAVGAVGLVDPGVGGRAAGGKGKAKASKKDSGKSRGHEIPEDAPKGFKSVRELLQAADKVVTGGKIKKGTKRARMESDDEDGDDEELEVYDLRVPEGVDIDDEDGEEDERDDDNDDDENLERLFAETTTFTKGKRKLKIAKGKSKSSETTKPTSKATPKVKTTSTTSAPISTSTRTKPTTKPASKKRKASPLIPAPVPSPSDDESETASQIQDKEARKRSQEGHQMAIDFFNTEGPLRLGNRETPLFTPPSSPDSIIAGGKVSGQAVSPFGGDEMDEETLVARRSRSLEAEVTSVKGKVGQGREAALQDVKTKKLSPGNAVAAAGFEDIVDLSMDWDYEPSQDPTPSRLEAQLINVGNISSPHHMTTGSYRAASGRITNPKSKSSSVSLTNKMPPPAVPPPSSPLISNTNEIEPTQFPIRRPGARKRMIMSSTEKPVSNGHRREGQAPASSDVDSPLIVRRIRPMEMLPDSSPAPVQRIRPRKEKRRPKVPEAQIKEYLDIVVSVSGSESSDEPLSDHSTHSDHLFASNFQPTQAPRGYNQHAAYLAGLSTQAAPGVGLKFKARHDTQAFLGKARKPILLTDDEFSGSDGGGGRRGGGRAGEDESENEYELGSFVCDDEDVAFTSQSDPLSNL